MSEPRLPRICSFWHGPLSWLEQLSIASFMDNGHQFDLYSYQRPDNLPDGCNWIDAAEIVSEDRLFFYKGSRSPAVFADLFRLELIRAGAGIWADCDMLCIRPFQPASEYFFGCETAPGKGAHAGQINNAVLGLPSDNPLLEALLNIFVQDSDTLDPVWLPHYRRLEVRIRRLLGQKVGLSHMQFGATGPFPLTYFARKHDVAKYALPVSAFYPLPYTNAPKMARSGSSLEAYVTDDTYGVHLWRMALTERSRQSTPPPPDVDSALGRAARQLGVRF